MTYVLIPNLHHPIYGYRLFDIVHLMTADEHALKLTLDPFVCLRPDVESRFA